MHTKFCLIIQKCTIRLLQFVVLQPNEQKLDLLNVVEKKEEPHTVVVNVFMDAVTHSFEKVSLDSTKNFLYNTIFCYFVGL